ncbi:MAG: LD-carboxypeptidase [Phycisphaerales bacterium]
MHDLTRPPALLPGDTIAVCTPSFPAHVRFRDKFRHGLSELERAGFTVKEGDLTAAGADEGHRAASPEARAAEINALFADESVRGIMTTIGGEVSSSLVPSLDFDMIRANPKVFCGYSDITSLHLAFARHAGLSTFYGPAVAPAFGEWPAVPEETLGSFMDATVRHLQGERTFVRPTRWSNHFRDAMTDAWREVPRRWQDEEGWSVVRPGIAEGPAVVGSLSTMLANAGTPVWPELDGAILFIEEMATSPGKVERTFRQLAAMGVFQQIVGLVWGRIESWVGGDAAMTPIDLLLESIRGALGGEPPFPIVTESDIAHTVPMLTLAQGTPVRLDASGARAELTVLAPMVVARGA